MGAGPACEVTLEREVAMTMRDGTTLLADIYTPVGAGPYDGRNATRKVFHDTARPSRLILPVIPGP